MTEQITDPTAGNEPAPARAKKPQRYVVGRVEDFPESGRLLVEVNGREIGVFQVDGEFHAVLNRCPHLGGPLCYGQIVSKVSSPAPGIVNLDRSQTLLTCPYHNWEFDIRTGQSYFDPHGLSARPFPIGVEAGTALQSDVQSGIAGMVPGPYQAEKFDVEVEEQYIVLTLKAPSRRRVATAPVPDGPTDVAVPGPATAEPVEPRPTVPQPVTEAGSAPAPVPPAAS
ncbi:Rieske (2Fe-2S) protein [Nakamurella flavida]|uniref:Rieske (2Fe-2S) protein n=1 Tax=Nakamurella flavida TaxID=363630 RepID=A0A938YKZ2_9ACTN|nr:Rieske (2Fe-2S) protein [Nakamurella flavida]MBM9476456.1 Rieske (2Fe-2S) protein [Nakamurella flavida]MDP9779443.1 3-phenylpropionate/trans-cinnamate dioxygenase ferredoxin subunit [Nakamurella flavida]